MTARDILLPSNAPSEYRDRQTLWNAVEKAEDQWNSQLARGIIMALPNKIPKEELETLVRDYCREQFVSRGMIADFAVHDKGDGNPHAHIMLTMRAMDENGRWLPKSRKVYDLDENGERIRLPSGEWKSRKEDIVDWNDRKYAEIWRTAWSDTVNRYYEKHGIGQRLDLRSYARQEKDILPTVHLGPAVAHMEEKGIPTEIGDYNRQIKAHNAKLSELRTLLASMKEWLDRIGEKLSVLFAGEEQEPHLFDFVTAYFELRKDGRYDWNAYAKQKCIIVDTKQEAAILLWMQQNGIQTKDDFDRLVEKYQPMIDQIFSNKKRIKRLETGINDIRVCSLLKPIADKSEHGFKFMREQYAEKHRDELGEYRKAVRYLKANGIDTKDESEMKKEMTALREKNRMMTEEISAAHIDPEIIRQIRHCVDTVLHEAEIPEKKKSVIARLRAPLPAEKSDEEEKKTYGTLSL